MFSGGNSQEVFRYKGPMARVTMQGWGEGWIMVRTVGRGKGKRGLRICYRSWWGKGHSVQGETGLSVEAEDSDGPMWVICQRSQKNSFWWPWF